MTFLQNTETQTQGKLIGQENALGTLFQVLHKLKNRFV